GAGVVDEAAGARVADGLGDGAAVAQDRVRRVDEPPGRSGVHGGVHAGQRGDLAGEHGLVDREQHGAEVRRVAHVVEHRAQVVDVVHGDGDVEADVGPELLED